MEASNDVPAKNSQQKHTRWKVRSTAKKRLMPLD